MTEVVSSNDEGYLTDDQRKVTSSVVFPAALLSIVGSSVIICSILREKDDKKRSYQCILMGLSIADIVYTVCLVINPFMLPSATSERIWASGNENTCIAAAFFLLCSISNYYYSCCLNFYFLCVIRYNMAEDRISKKVEPYLHSVAIGVPLLGASVMAALGALGADDSAGALCMVDLDKESDDYERNVLLGVIFLAIPMVLMFAFIIVVNFIIYRHVRVVINRLRRFSIQAGDEDGDAHQAHKIREVATQNALFVGAFTLIIVVPLVNTISNAAGVTEEQLFPIIIMENFLTPLQGFFNVAIFTRPRYVAARKQFPHETKWWALQRAFFSSTRTKSEDIQLTVNPQDSSSTLQSKSSFNFSNWLSRSKNNVLQRTEQSKNDTEKAMDKEQAIK